MLATTANAQTVEQLKRELAAKNAQISKLERRLRELESRQPAAEKPTLITAPVATVPAAVPVAAAPPPPDDEEMERALERTLVREGALVLSPWTFEFAPQFSYAHWDKIQDPYIRNSYSAGASFRMGLPWQSQVSVTLPYVWSEGRDGFPSSSGLGDAGVLLSKELLIENGWVPNLVGSVGWTSPTSQGNTFGPIPYVSGFQAGLTASSGLIRWLCSGGLLFLLGIPRGCRHAIQSRRCHSRQDRWLARRQSGLLCFDGLQCCLPYQRHAADFVIPNSDRVLSSVDVTFSTIVWTRTLFNITGQFGITGHVPDFRLITSLPIRF